MKTFRTLIVVAACTDETALPEILGQLAPGILDNSDSDILVIDAPSADKGFSVADALGGKNVTLQGKIKVFRDRSRLGYGGNQKLGFHYAVSHGYDAVVVLGGDGRYASDLVQVLVDPIKSGDADAVFGSRMLGKDVESGGQMPFYKYLGNRLVTALQNLLLASHISEFHAGYRAYSTRLLRSIPFQFNTNDFHFDTEIAIQCLDKKARIVELPIPRYHNKDMGCLRGLRYAVDVLREAARYRLMQIALFYDRKYDLAYDEPPYRLHIDKGHIHRKVSDMIAPGSKVLELGCSTGFFSRHLKEKDCFVVGADLLPESRGGRGCDVYHQVNFNDLQAIEKLFSAQNLNDFDYVLLMDVVEHLHEPDKFLNMLNNYITARQTLILSTANIAFIAMRLLLLFGIFSYGKRGILDVSHHRLHTFSSLRRDIERNNFKIEWIGGSILPLFHPGTAGNVISSAGNKLLMFLLGLSKRLFAFQIIVRLRKQPRLEELIAQI